jgi:cytidylate kinase
MTVVAVDGPAGAGKSTIARAVAEALGFDYLDTGALYRAVALAALRRGVPVSDGVGVAELVPELNLVAREGRVLLNGEDVSARIRAADVTAVVSTVAAHEEVRAALIDYQQEVGARSNVVMEGRDIGVTVAPDAAAKIWLTASLEERARRRAQEGDESQPHDIAKTMAELSERDAADASRAASPLSRPADAVTVDSTGKGVEEVVAAVLRVVRRKLDDRD